MGKYLFAYYRGMTASTPEEQKKSMDAWMGWFSKLGEAVTEMGAPTIPGKMVSKGGNEAIGDNPITGYTVIMADNLDATVDLAHGCPSIPDSGQIAVYELIAM